MPAGQAKIRDAVPALVELAKKAELRDEAIAALATNPGSPLDYVGLHKVRRYPVFALAILLFMEWWDSADAHFRRVVWTASLSLAATPLMGLPIFPSNHVVLILPFILILALVWERWPRYRTLRVGLLFLMVLLIPFGLYYRVVTVYDPLVIDLISTLPPLAAILGLYWMRWWVLRSPRTLFDRTGD